MITKAMIMAAGAGTRLGALCSILPKPLVPIAGAGVIDIILKRLASFGIKDVIANTFFKAELIQKHCVNNSFGVNFNYIQETELSGTAGGLSKCRHFFDDTEDFIVMSGDGLSDVDINEAYYSHKNSDAIVSIVTKEIQHKDVSKYGIIVPDENGFVKSFQEKPSLDEVLSNLANTGIYIFNRRIFDYIPENIFYDFAKDVFPALIAAGEKINTYNHCGYWSDIGSIEQYKQSNFDVLNGLIPSIKPDIIKEGYITGRNTAADDSAEIINSCIGQNCSIGANVSIKNSILWDNVKAEDNVSVENAVILTGAVIKADVKDSVIAGWSSSALQR